MTETGDLLVAEAYLNQHDLDLRLDRTICMYDGVPVYVRTYGLRHNHPLIDIFKLNGQIYKAWKTIDHKEDLFCDRATKLGYLNYGDSAYYLERVPHRHQNQGLRVTNLHTVPGLSRYGNDWFVGKEMEQCILGKYPSYTTAIKSIESGTTGVAIHRCLSISLIDSRSRGLFYKGRLVAMWDSAAEQWDYLKNPDISYIERIIRKLGVL